MEDRTSETLLGVNKERTAPGSIVISDCWKAYSCLSQKVYEHLTVNHSHHFVDPNTLAHTIEWKWREAKRKVLLRGRRKKHFTVSPGPVHFLTHYQDMNVRLLHAAASLYPPA